MKPSELEIPFIVNFLYGLGCMESMFDDMIRENRADDPMKKVDALLKESYTLLKDKVKDIPISKEIIENLYELMYNTETSKLDVIKDFDAYFESFNPECDILQLHDFIEGDVHDILFLKANPHMDSKVLLGEQTKKAAKLTH